jgi:AcrR family transcriptional regulator
MQIDMRIASTTAQPARAERVDAAENRARILAVAERLFEERGVANVCMAEIAKEAGVGKGTLYRRFANKGELCLALIDSQMREFQNTSLLWMHEMTISGATSLEQLKGFLERLLHFTHRHMPVLYEVQQHYQEIDRGRLVRPHFWQYMTVHGLLVTAVRAGEMPSSVDTAYLAEALLAPLSATLFRFQLEELGFSLERISAGMRTLVDGLGRLNWNTETKLPAK